MRSAINDFESQNMINARRSARSILVITKIELLARNKFFSKVQRMMSVLAVFISANDGSGLLSGIALLESIVFKVFT